MAVLLLLIGIQSAIGDQKSSMPNILLTAAAVPMAEAPLAIQSYDE